MKGLILFHGAGGHRDHPLYLALEEQLDIPVGRINFPYRIKAIEAGKNRPPDRMPKLVESVNETVENATKKWKVDPSEVAIGGRSLGGRACSVAIAEGLEVGGLVLLSYPLHPPGKPEKLRVDHFPELDLPVLLVQGDRDPFGTPAEFAEHIQSIPGPVTQLWLTGPRSNHDPKGREEEIIPAIQSFLS